jgi:hypothetical protein
VKQQPQLQVRHGAQGFGNRADLDSAVGRVLVSASGPRGSLYSSGAAAISRVASDGLGGSMGDSDGISGVGD